MHYSPNDANGGQGREVSLKNWRELTGFSELYDYWNSGRVDGDLPLTDKFDLLAVTQWLPNIMLLDVFDRENVVARFAGTAMVDRLGFDITRENVFATQSDVSRDRVINAYSIIVNKPCGMVARYTNHYSSGRSGTVSTLYLPLKATANGNARIVGMVHREEDAGYAEPIERTQSGTDIQSAEWVDLGFGVPSERP
ncbi:MAG: PAS domain-containing protein [Pseudomonadota bacterium]